VPDITEQRFPSGRLQLLIVLCLGVFFCFIAAYNTFRWEFVLFGVFLELAIIPATLAVLALPFMYAYLLVVHQSDERGWYLLALIHDLLIVAGLAWATFK